MEHIPALMELTGLDDFEKAKRILILKNFNLDEAVNHILDEEPNAVDRNDASTSANHCPTHETVDLEDEVRAPIPRKRELLVTPDDDNFLMKRRKIGAQRLIPLRNFAREGELAETDNDENRKKRRLEDMFMPPAGLFTEGPLDWVQNRANHVKKWILINIQDNTCFQSQCLNRDCWNDKNLQYFIKKYFLFSQMAVDSMGGSRFVSFYNVDKFPFICILDPRTAGNQKTLTISENLNAKQVIVELYEFIKLNGKFPENGEPKDHNGHYSVNIPRNIMPDNFKDFVIESIPSSSKDFQSELPLVSDDQPSTIDLTEEQQIKLAIQQSLAIIISDSDDSDVGGMDDDEIIFDKIDKEISKDNKQVLEAKNKNYKNFLGSESEAITQLHCRFPDDKKIMLKWPASSKLKALKLYLNEDCKELIAEPHKIIMTHPTRNLSLESDDATLEQLGLHPSATLFIQPDD